MFAPRHQTVETGTSHCLFLNELTSKELASMNSPPKCKIGCRLEDTKSERQFLLCYGSIFSLLSFG